MPCRVGDILFDCTALLENALIEEARLLCENVVSHILGTGRLELHIMAAEPVAPARQRRIRKAVSRLAAGEPLQYVLGFADFMGRLFKVNRHCLIPRPETEELVAWILKTDAVWHVPVPLIADIGTGSGIIAVTLALEKPVSRLIASDISARTLTVAKANAAAHDVIRRIRFRRADLLEGIKRDSLDVVISNPPYVRTADFLRLAGRVRDHEPRSALDAGPSGLEVITRLTDQTLLALKPRGFLFMEIGADQAKAVEQILAAAGFSDCVTRKDLTGRDRMVRARKPDSP